MNKIYQNIGRTLLPLALGAFILYWVYHDFDFDQVADVLLYGTDWFWMSVSLFFGVFSHVLRGWRWKQTLEPLQMYPRTRNCVDSIFVSYAANLVLPRVGEVSRCGILKQYDHLPLPQTLGTVVTERVIDSLLTLIIAGVAFLWQMPVFFRFFQQTGTKIPSFVHLLHSPWFYVSLFCVVGVCFLLYRLMHGLSAFKRVQGMLRKVMDGITSLRKVKNVPLFLIYTIGIWACYFFHFYLTFFCFHFSENLSVAAGLVLFVAGTFAVIVPTPNGAGPWHFAVITMMMLYGVGPEESGLFALIVHGIQTLLVVVLGIVGWLHLVWSNKKR